MRESFILYTEIGDHMKLLTNEQRGILFTAILAYERGEDLPEMDQAVSILFSFIKIRLDINEEKYKETCEARSRAGRAGGRPKANAFDEKQEKAKKANAFSEKQSEAKKAEYEYEYENDIEKIDKDTPKGVSKENRSKRFSPPTVDEVKEYCLSRGNKVDADRFVAYYQSNGWRVGKNPMKDWKASVRTWERSEFSDRKGPVGAPKTNQFNNFTGQNNYDFAELEKQLLQ